MLPHHFTPSLTVHSTHFSKGTFARPIVKDRMIVSLVIMAFIIWCPKETTFSVTQFRTFYNTTQYLKIALFSILTTTS